MFFDFSLTSLIVIVPVVLISLTIHELSHGLMANFFGDPTPKVMGRLTLNPIKHLDPIGALLLLFAGFGWAKPVQVNPYYFGDEKKDKMMFVALAGPLSNIVMALIAAIIFSNIHLTGDSLAGNLTYLFFNYMIMINVFLAAFNLLPIPPLDGAKILGGVLSDRLYQKFQLIEDKGFLILMILIMTDATDYIVKPLAITILDFIKFVAGL